MSARGDLSSGIVIPVFNAIAQKDNMTFHAIMPEVGFFRLRGLEP